MSLWSMFAILGIVLLIAILFLLYQIKKHSKN